MHPRGRVTVQLMLQEGDLRGSDMVDSHKGTSHAAQRKPVLARREEAVVYDKVWATRFERRKMPGHTMRNVSYGTLLERVLDMSVA